MSEIAGSSMFLYLSHTQVRSLVIRLFHGPMPRVALILAIMVGIVFARTYNWFERQVLIFAKTNRRLSIGRITKDALTLISAPKSPS